MNITVIGTGRLGAPYAAGMATLDHHVLGVDANPTP
jgi:UDPglucose 6-dehydrogenase